MARAGVVSATISDEQFAARELVRGWAASSGAIAAVRAVEQGEPESLAGGLRRPGATGHLRGRRARGTRRRRSQCRGPLRHGRRGGGRAGARPGRHDGLATLVITDEKVLDALTSGQRTAGVALGSDIAFDGTTATGTAKFVLGGLADGMLVLPAGADWIYVDAAAAGVTVGPPGGHRLLPTAGERRVVLGARHQDRAALPARRRPGGDGAGRGGVRTRAVDARHRIGVREGARAVRQADRQLPGRQAHVRRDAAALPADRGRRGRRRQRGRSTREPDQLSIAVAVASAVGIEAEKVNARDCIQVLGGIGITWEHDAHLYLRRAYANAQFLGGRSFWLRRCAQLTRDGVRRQLHVDVTAGEDIRAEVAGDRRRHRRAARGEAAGRSRRDGSDGAALAEARTGAMPPPPSSWSSIRNSRRRASCGPTSPSGGGRRRRSWARQSGADREVHSRHAHRRGVLVPAVQ